MGVGVPDALGLSSLSGRSRSMEGALCNSAFGLLHIQQLPTALRFAPRRQSAHHDRDHTTVECMEGILHSHKPVLRRQIGNCCHW